MVWRALPLIILVGCVIGHPVIGDLTTVDKYQKYEMPKHFEVEFEVLPLGQVIRVCGDALGCIKHIGPRTNEEGQLITRQKAFIIDNKRIAEHECEHPIYGPKHVGD